METIEKNRMIRNIHRIGTMLNSTKKLNVILHNILEVVRKAFNADIIILYEYDQKSEIISFPIFSGDVHHLDPIIDRPEKLEYDVVYKIIGLGKSYFAEDAKNDSIMSGKVINEEMDPNSSFTYREGIQSSCGIILKNRKEILGTLFFNYRSKKKFTKEDKNLMEIFSSYVVLAHRNARQKDDLMRRLAFNSYEINGIRTIVHNPKSLYFEKLIIKKVLNDILKFFGEKLGYYAEYDKKNEKIIIRVTSKSYKLIKGASWSVNQGVTGLSIQTKQEKIVPNIHKLGRKILRFSEGDVKGLITKIDSLVNSTITVPMLLYNNEVLGVFHFESENYNNYSKYDAEIIKSLIDIAVDSIQNGRLIRQNNLYQTKLKRIHELDKLIISRMSIDQILHNIITIAKKLTKTKIRRAHFALIEQTKKGELVLTQYPQRVSDVLNLTVRSDNGKAKPYSIYSEFNKRSKSSGLGNKGITRLAIQKNETINIDDTDPLWDKHFIAVVDGIRSELVVPLRLRGKPIGILNLESEEAKAFDEADVEIIETLASQATIVLLMNKLVDDMKLLGLKSLSLPKEKFTEFILSKGRELLGADMGAIWLYDSFHKQLQFCNYFGFNENILRRTTPDLNNSFIKTVLDKQKITISKVKKYLDQPNHKISKYFKFLYDEGIKYMISIPYVVDKSPIGIMNLYYKDEFNEIYWNDSWEKSIMEIFVSQVSIALQNFNLYYELNQRIPLKIFDTTKQMLMFITHSLNNIVGNIRADVIDLINDSNTFDKETNEYLNNIYESSLEALKIPEQLANFIKKLNSVKTSVSVYEVIDLIFKEKQSPNVNFNFEKINNLPPVRANRELLKEIFAELIQNAYKAMPNGGLINIYGKVINSKILSISVEDTGHGIPKQNIDKIFDFGYTSWPKAKGKGDGLSLIKVVLETDLEGKMSVQSSLNKGTVFTVELPISNL